MTRLFEKGGRLSEASNSGLMKIKIISAGQGSSGDYPVSTIQKLAEAQVIKPGTHMHVDHPTITERIERPERSVTTIAAVTESDPWFEGDAAWVWARPFEAYKKRLAELKDVIGVSIVAEGFHEADGKTVAEITDVRSIDFVTEAGRGGSIVEMYEAAHKSILEGSVHITEATAHDVEGYLDDLIQRVYGSEDHYTYVIDLDDTYVYFSDRDSSTRDRKTYRQPYAQDGVNVTLNGSREEVKRETQYSTLGSVQVTESISPNPLLQEEENIMEITETEHKELRESADRVPVIESERDAEKARADKHQAVLAEALVKSAFDAVGVEAPDGRKSLIEEAVQAGTDFDVESFKELVEKRADEYAPSGSVAVTNHGEPAPLTESKDISEEDILATLKEV